MTGRLPGNGEKGNIMTDPGEILNRLFGEEIRITETRPVSGGDINQAYLLCLSNGKRLFLKENTERNAGFFRAETAGLEAIRRTKAVRVPEVLDTGTAKGRAYLLMEYLDAAPRIPDYWESFGRQLAALHRADTSEWTPGGRYGFPEDNYIGAGEQKNTVRGSWPEFFRECRLEPQFQKAQHYFDRNGRKRMQSLLDRLEEYLPEPEFPSLLHGDLWGGNFVTGPDGAAWLIDPAVYVGHAEADLAMTELFGGFSPVFYGSYREVNPTAPGYEDRRDLYNLYHLLNHLNLFGSGYYASVVRIIGKYSR